MKLFKTIYPYFYMLWLGLTYGLIKSFIYFPGSIVGEDTPVLVSIGLGIAYFGSVIGMTYSMIKDKAWK